jgi:hypothetical protein
MDYTLSVHIVLNEETNDHVENVSKSCAVNEIVEEPTKRVLG